MVKTTRRKKTSKLKRFPYIEVAGIENRYLDAALLRTCGSTLEIALDDELKILKKAGISLPKLKKQKYSQEELIEKVSPYLLENYDFYNFLVNQWDDIQNDIISNNFDDVDYTKFLAEDWYRELIKLNSSEMPSYGVINFLRFYKNGEFKELIKRLFEKEDFVVGFFQQTGIKVDGIDIDGFSLEDKDNPLDVLNNDKTFDFLEGITAQATLKAAAKLILDVSNRIDNIQEEAAYREKYELEKEEKKILETNFDELTLKVKSNESHLKTLTKENRTHLKNVVSLNEKLDQLQKENGRLGGLVGDVRKEKDALKKINTTLEKRVATLEKEASSVAEKTKKQIEKKHDTKGLKMQIEFDERTSELESKIKELERLLDEEQVKTSAFSVTFEEKEHQLKTVKNDLQVVEKERNDLAEQLKNAPAPTEEIRDDEDDLLYGFNEEDIEKFVEFDNKPTRN